MSKAMEGLRSYGIALIALCLAGCGRSSAPAFPEWSGRSITYSPQPNSSNAFDKYALAALSAESSGTAYLERVFFPPNMKQRALGTIAQAMSLVAQGTKLQSSFQFTPTAPNQPPLYQRGWRLIGRGFVWKIEAAVEKEDYDQAIYYTTTATKFGFDLTGGSSTDAALGLVIINESRKAMAKALGRLTHTQLKKLGNGLAFALKNRPSLEKTIANEEQNMLAAVQYVQDCYRSEKFEDLRPLMGSWGHPAVKYLQQLKSKDTKERPGFFEGFAKDVKTETDWALQQINLPAKQRKEEPDLGKDRAWRRFSRSFIQTLNPLIVMNDDTLARTRLFILQAYLQQGIRLGQNAPRSLKALSPELTTDPYSGDPFIYRADGLDFDIYSVGPDLKDDGGETDESYTTPDLRAETSLR